MSQPDAASYYPLFFDLRGRSVLVIGGGETALEKVNGLLAAEAKVQVVAPTLCDGLAQLRDDGLLNHLPREYRSGDMCGQAIVMAACDDGSAHERLQLDARAIGVPINAADDPSHCDFILPAVVRQAPLTLAISTGGGSPAIARRLREELSDYLKADTASLADLVAELRMELRRLGAFSGIEADAWQAAMDGEVRILLAQRRRGQAKARLLDRLCVAIRAVNGEP